jgi:1-deoxy-D-xylulose-5-phosphate synthase
MGPTVGYALAAAEGRPEVGVVNARFVKPLDGALLREIAADARAIVTIEDHTTTGGLGSAVLEELADARLPVSVVRLGIHDVTVPHGDPGLQHEELGYGPRAIGRVLDQLLGAGEPSAHGVAAGGHGDSGDRASAPVDQAGHEPLKASKGTR